MAVTAGHTLVPSGAWAPVPLAFPAGRWATVAHWAAEISAALFGSSAADLVAVCEDLAARPAPLAGAVERLLWLGDVRVPRLVHLYAAEDVGADAGPELPVERLAVAGLGAHVQTLREVAVPGFDRAVECILVIASPDGATAFAVRWLGWRDGVLLVLDFVSDDAAVIAYAQADLEQLFASVVTVTG